ncbi:MAG: rhodanese-like domain-containing protein [Alphaproteobacteria bacterium]|nr:MAG: rhodanese-like domain-containing protein [Alphaproteobacteria bacterium]
MSKQYSPYFFAILLAFVIFAPSIATADTSTSSDGDINISACEAKVMIDEGNVFLLDVRTPAEFKAAHIKEAINIPDKNVPSNDPDKLGDAMLLSARINEVPKDKPVIIYCLTGGRSLNASKTLMANGYTNVYNLKLGIPSWIDARLPVISTFVDESNIDECIKNSLNPKIDRVFLHLEKGNDSKAKQELDKFNLFVNNTESAGKLNFSQTGYLRNESKLIRNMI